MAEEKKYSGLTAYLDGKVKGAGYKRVALIERIESPWPDAGSGAIMYYRKTAHPHHVCITGVSVYEERGPVIYVIASAEELSQQEIADIVPGQEKGLDKHQVI